MNYDAADLHDAARLRQLYDDFALSVSDDLFNNDELKHAVAGMLFWQAIGPLKLNELDLNTDSLETLAFLNTKNYNIRLLGGKLERNYQSHVPAV